MLIDEKQLDAALKQTVESFKIELKKVRTGKADADVIGSTMVEAYGGQNPLNSVGQVQVEDAMNVKITVWDKGVLPNVEKALRESSIGGSVVMDKEAIRIKFNPMTQEDRDARVKELGQETEDYRVRVRQVRHEYKKEIEGLTGVSEDDQKRDEETLQKKVDATIASIEELSKAKEEELLKI